MKFNASVGADVCQAVVEQSPAHRATLNQRRRKVAEKRLCEYTGLSWGTSETLSCVYASDHAVMCMGGFLFFLFFHCLLHKWRRHKGAYPIASCYASHASAKYTKVASMVHKFWRRQKRVLENKLMLFKLWCLVLYYLIYGKLYRASKRCKKKFTQIAHHVKLVYINAASFIYHRLPSLRVSAMVVFLWLFMSGDIELNPGPGRGHLTSDDLRVVRKAIWDARSKWFTLGIELKMSINSLEVIKQKNKENPDDCLTEMLLEWLKQANPKPTWSSIVTALREPTVGLEQLAESIENQQLKAVHNKDLTTSENEASCSSGIKLGKRRTRDELCFPHIDEIAPDKEQRKALEERLQIESKEIMFKFYILINKFFDSLEEQAIPAQKLEWYLRMPLQTEKLTINTVQDAQKIIEDNSSFYDYQLVEYMIEVAGTDNDRQALQKYKESFIHYAQRRVFECPAKLATRTSGDVKLMIKLDSHYKYKLAELKEFQERVCQILQIPFYVSKLHCVKKGCFQVTFLIPGYYQKTTFPLTSEQKSDLAKLKALCLICGKYEEDFRKGGAEVDNIAFDNDSDSDDDCNNPVVKSISSEDNTVDDLTHHMSTESLVDKSSSVEQSVILLNENSSRIVRRSSIGRSERRRHTGRSAASPSSTPPTGSPLSVSPTVWNFDPYMSSSSISRTPPRMSPTLSSDSLRMSPSAYNIDSVFFRQLSPIESVSYNQGILPGELLVAAAKGDELNVAILINLHHINVLYKDTQGNSALHYATRHGHLKVIKYLIRHGADIADLGQDDMSLLHTASTFNHMHIVRFLISEHNINPCCLDCYKRTPFFVACMYGHLGIAEYLLKILLKYKELKDIINSKDIHGETVIHTACKMGHLEIVRWLMNELNYDPNSIVPGWMNRMPLHYAAENGHVHIVKLLIEDFGYNPSCTDINGFTPLLLASFNGQLEVVTYLTVEKHCDPMFRDNMNNTPLHAAAYNGHISIVKFLISMCNCDPRAPGKDNRTPLHYAAGNSHLHVVKYLIEHENCDPECLDGSKCTPLHLASAPGDLETVKYLVYKKNCDPNVRNINNETPLHVATLYAQLNVVRFFVLKLHCDPNTPGWNDSTPLHHAAQEGHLNVVKFLIEEQHCDPECLDRNNATPLHLASMKGHLHILKYLALEKGCNVSCRTSNNETILHIAAFNGHLDLVRIMISYLHCDPNTRGWKGTNSTPLHCAAQEGHLQIVKYLIEEQYCDPACQNGDKVTPLHLASMKGHLDTVKYFVFEKRCDPKCRNINNETPLHSAVINGQLELVKFFITELKCDPNTSGLKDTDRTSLHYAAEEGHLRIIKYLIEEQNCDPACLDRNSVTPLHLASIKGHMDTIKYLTVDKNCDPAVKNNKSATPLHLATLSGHYEVIRFLISESNCDPNTPGWNKRTPLHHAAQEGHLKIVRYLIEERHCDPSCQDIDKFTPLHFASFNGQLNTVKYLIEEQQCNPECQNVNKVTPLFLASEKGHLDIVKYLTLEKCCDPIGRNGDHNTPLHYASANGHLEVIKFFVSSLNCDPNMPGFAGITPLHYSIHSGNIPLVKYMVEEVKCNLQALDNFRRAPVMAASKHLPCLQYLCEIGCDPTVTDMHGATLLHLAAQEEIVDYLIRENHFDPNTPGWTSRTPLHCAAEHGHLNLLDHLITKYGCQPTLTDTNGDTPLHFAAAQGHLPVIKHLTLDLNSDSMQTDNYGNIALHDAARNGHLEVVRFLVETLHCPVKTRGSCHMTPLEWAFFKGHFHVVKYLNQVEEGELMILGD